MTFDALDTWWWPFVYILIAGWLATDSWRFLGVYLGGRLSSDSEILVLVRAVATALVAGVISSLVIAPSGPLAETALLLRVGAAAAGFASYILFGRRILVGIFVGEAVLVAGMLMS
ncbi:AzlD domain-containing protein [Pararhizobium haloflavum]|uniref:AzlD domain-containing protein n=1 Tax=Pararhizobium haloflavum TaxID=2037914 RepID=UPI000C19D77F|nr:AzlD domain-containing protein [Pararhizobium haloflavum]